MTKDLKVIQISAAYSGAQKQIEDAIYTELTSKGIDSKVLYWVGESDNHNYIKCETFMESLVRRFCIKYIKKSYHYSLIQTYRAIRIIRAYKPDVVHLHSIHHGYVHFPMLFAFLRKSNIRIIYTVHDMWPFTGGCYHYTNLACNNFMKGCHNCPNKLKNVDCRIKDTASLLDTKLQCYKNQDIIFVAVSEWVSEEMKRSSINDYPCTVIKNCVGFSPEQDVRFTKESFLELTRGFKTVLFVAASWEIGKGFEFICNLSSILGDDYRLVLVGNASDELRRKATSNMLFTGYVDHKDLCFFYRNCNIHASASVEETFGMTFVEAAFEGTKSIGFNSTGIKYTLRDVNGVCVKSYDVNEFASAILDHINDPRFTNEEIEIYKSRFSPKRMADEYINLYMK